MGEKVYYNINEDIQFGNKFNKKDIRFLVKCSYVSFDNGGMF